jgi:glycosyltransferase involved in cell wall biosynthesis
MKPVWGLFKQGFTKADGLQAISQFLLKWGERMGATGIMRVVPNGVDIKQFTTPIPPEEVQRMKDSLGKKQGEVYLVTTSRLVHKNAIDDVIRALAHLPPHISFLVYGLGTDESSLRDVAKQEGVTDRVRFMGQASHPELPLILAASDIFIRPSRSEGMGNSFIEAMAAGLPVIATQEGGIADFLFDAKRNPDREATGWAVDKNAPEQIAETVAHILANPTEVATVCARAKELVTQEYDWNLISRNMREMLDSLT